MTRADPPAYVADDGGGDSLWPAWLSPGILLTLAVLALVLLLVSVIIVRRALRRLRRNGTLERGMLAARARGLAPGPARGIPALRMRLRDELESTTRVLNQTSATDVATVQLAPVLAGLQRTAAAMDADLATLQSESNRDRQHSELERYRAEVDTLIGAATRLRDTAARTAAVNRETELSAIAAQVDEQVSYLDTYQQNYRRQYQPNELDLDDHGSQGDPGGPNGGPRA